MKRYSSAFFLAFACAHLLSAAIDGTVVNRTTGKPAPNVSITLIKPGQNGMRTLGATTSDAAGHFAFDKDEPGGGPQLLQASYQGVNYNKLLTPASPTSNLELEVYDATKSPAVAEVATRMLVFESTSSQLSITETAILKNQSNTTYSNASEGALRFYLPPAANGQVHVTAQGPQGMPLPRAAEKTEQQDVYKVNFPVRPGETELEVHYVLPAGTPFTYRGRVISVKGMRTGPLRLIAPSGITLAGKDVRKESTEPKTQATIYTVLSPDAFSVEVTGTGGLHAADDAAGSESEAPVDASDSPQIVEAKPLIYRHLPWLLALALSILGVGLVMLYRSSPVHSPSGK